MGKILYFLQSEKSGRFYIGSTDNIARRFDEHNAGQTKSTKPGRPWKLVYKHVFTESSFGLMAERKIKSLKSRRILEELISGKLSIESLL